MSLPLTAPADADPDIADLLAARPHLTMHAQDGLVLEDSPLAGIADALGTPVWVYGAATIRARLAALKATVPAHIHYAVKANDHLAILRLMAAGGAGADVVSLGEFLRAREAGIAAADIVFSGVGKTPDELRATLAAGVGQVNVESPAELQMLAAAAAATGTTATITLRVNPDVDALTHPKISTGRAQDKFGVPLDEAVALFSHAASLPGIHPVGVAVHIGSQVTTLPPYRAAYAKVASLVQELRAGGHALDRIDCGGGFGIAYRDGPALSLEAFAGCLRTVLGPLGLRLMIEPGRWLVGPAGVLLATVVLTKGTVRPLLVLDAAMNDLVRPAMYDSWHGIVPLSPVAAVARPLLSDVVGPVCESSDRFATSRDLPPLAAGGRVAILDAGAYGAVMSSTYNARPLAAIALVDGSRWTTIRARQPMHSLWAGEHVPAWLT